MVFLIGIVGILLTVLLHASMITFLISVLKRHETFLLRQPGAFRRSLVMATAASLLAVKHAVDILIWGLLHWTFAEGALESFTESYYFSAVTYTTLGYGDIVLGNRWRMLCGFEAMSGVLLFGLSTAILFSLVQRLWADANS